MRRSFLIPLAALTAIGIGACGSSAPSPTTTRTTTKTWTATCYMKTSTGANVTFNDKSGVAPDAVTVKFYASDKVIGSTSTPISAGPGQSESLGVVIFNSNPTPTSCKVTP
jgi:hypothetical protein